MKSNMLTLRLLREKFGICRLDPDAPIPDWVKGSFYSITKTLDELSIICREDAIPAESPCETNWRALMIEGPLDFSLTGIIASISSILANNQISLFVLSTYDTDYILIKDHLLDKAVSVLRANHYEIVYNLHESL